MVVTNETPTGTYVGLQSGGHAAYAESWRRPLRWLQSWRSLRTHSPRPWSVPSALRRVRYGSVRGGPGR